MKYYRRQKKLPPAHLDDWLMTYADMITLLLCFFAIFLSVSLPRKDKEVTLQKPVEVVHKAPDILQGNLPFHGVPSIVFASPEEAQYPPPSMQSATEFQRLSQKTGAKVEQQGDRITTLEMSSAAFFDVGSATLSEAGKLILRDVTETLKSDKYKDYTVTVEGHTDDSPISTLQFPSNWELSTARAAAVVHFFLDQGIQAQKLRAAGYADTFPKAPNRDAAGNALPDNQAQNRRVMIKLEKIEKAQSL